MSNTIAQVARAFAEGREARGAYFYTDGSSYWLHGNRIAWHEPGAIIASFCGWYTPSTLNHLKAISQACGGIAGFGYGSTTCPNTDPFKLR